MFEELGITDEKLRLYLPLFCIFYLLNFITYTYFFTDLGFTNHTIPQVWQFGYPSWRTTAEGRWFGDILMYIIGGSGVAQFDMGLAVALQILNSFLFCAIFELRGRWNVGLVTMIFCFHPAVLDYYGWTADHLNFVFGDTLVLLGFSAIDRTKSLQGFFAGTLSFVLAIATYQPKLALICLIFLLWCLKPCVSSPDGATARQLLFNAGRAALAVIIAVALYYVSSRLTVTQTGGFRQKLNGLSELMSETYSSYGIIARNFSTQVDYLPSALLFLPLALIILASLTVLTRAFSRGFFAFFMALLMLSLVPIALRVSYILNNQTWENVGRILTPHLYLLAWAYAALATAAPWVQRLSRAGFLLLAYFFIIVAAQESTSAALYDRYNTSRLDRIQNDIAKARATINAASPPLVVIGLTDRSYIDRVRRYANQLYRAGVRSDPFAPFRQIEITNFFIGKDAVSKPTRAQVATALEASKGHPDWPQPGSVFAVDDIVVVKLGPLQSGITQTVD